MLGAGSVMDKEKKRSLSEVAADYVRSRFFREAGPERKA